MGFVGTWALADADAWGFVLAWPPVARVDGAAVLTTLPVGRGARPTGGSPADGVVLARAAVALDVVVVAEMLALGAVPPAVDGPGARIANAAIPTIAATPTAAAAIGPTFERGGEAEVLAASPCVDDSATSARFPGETANGVSISAVFANMAASDTGAEGGTCDPGTIECPASAKARESASAISLADENRPATSLEHARSNHASTEGGSSGTFSVGFGSGAPWIKMASAPIVSASKGRTPVSASNATTPTAQRSDLGPMSFAPTICSGLM